MCKISSNFADRPWLFICLSGQSPLHDCMLLNVCSLQPDHERNLHEFFTSRCVLVSCCVSILCGKWTVSMTVQFDLIQNSENFSLARECFSWISSHEEKLCSMGDVDGGDILRDYQQRLCHFLSANSNFHSLQYMSLYIQYTSIYCCGIRAWHCL